MDIVEALTAHRSELLEKVKHVDAAIKALGGSSERRTTKGRKMSEEGRRNIRNAVRKRWAAIRAKKKG